jgi:hypothetical protein
MKESLETASMMGGDSPTIMKDSSDKENTMAMEFIDNALMIPSKVIRLYQI